MYYYVSRYVIVIWDEINWKENHLISTSYLISFFLKNCFLNRVISTWKYKYCCFMILGYAKLGWNWSFSLQITIRSRSWTELRSHFGSHIWTWSDLRSHFEGNWSEKDQIIATWDYFFSKLLHKWLYFNYIFNFLL